MPGTWPCNGVEAHIFERGDDIGGKLAQTIPWERLSRAVWEREIDRFKETPNIHINTGVSMSKDKVEEAEKGI